MTQMFPELEKLQDASFPMVLSCLFMFDFIGCRSFYINWLYDFHSFVFFFIFARPFGKGLSQLREARAAVTSAFQSWSQNDCKFINQLLNSCCCSRVKYMPGETATWSGPWSCCDLPSGYVGDTGHRTEHCSSNFLQGQNLGASRGVKSDPLCRVWTAGDAVTNLNLGTRRHSLGRAGQRIPPL